MRTGWLTAVEFTLRLREFGLFSLVCHVVHSSGWIDLPVCGLQMYHLEISWSCTFSKQMCYLTIGSASTVFFKYQWPCNMYSVYFKVASQCTYVCVCVCHHCRFYQGLPLAHCCFVPFAQSDLCTGKSSSQLLQLLSTFHTWSGLFECCRTLWRSASTVCGVLRKNRCVIYIGTYWWTIIDIQIYNSVPASWMYPTPKPKFAQLDGLVWLSHSKVNHCDRDHAWASSIIVREPVAIMTVPHTSGSGQVGFTRNSPSRTGWSCA